MLERLSKADKISLGGAVLLLIGLFLPWYGLDIPGGDLLGGAGVDLSVNAFESSDVLDLLLLLIAVGVGVLIVLIAMGKLDAGLAQFLLPAGGLAVLVVLWKLIDKPDLVGLRFGIFVALIGALAIAGGQLAERMGKL